jgi:hypothetical protein
MESNVRGNVESPKGARREFREGFCPFLARPRELRGRMCKGIVLIGSPHLTKRALDAGDSARFQAFSLPRLFSHSDGVPPSVPARVTHTVGRKSGNGKDR